MSVKPILVCIAVLLSAALMGQTTYQVDAKASKMIWTGRKLTGQHQGTVDVKSGSVGWSADGLADAEIVIDMASIAINDMDPEYSAQLRNHLNSVDFFNTAKYKTANFKSTGVEAIPNAAPGQPNFKVTGNLTIKDITRPVSFPVLAWKDKKGVRAAGTLVFDRTLYDIKYRSGQFFDALGDKLIEDQVEIAFDVLAR